MTSTRQRRIATVLSAPVAALATWALARAAGVDLVVSLSGTRRTVGPLSVVATALVAALAGWLVVSLIERHSRRPHVLWARVSSTALAVSIIGPSWCADGASVVALIAMHLVTAAVVITGLAGSIRLAPRAAVAH